MDGSKKSPWCRRYFSIVALSPQLSYVSLPFYYKLVARSMKRQLQLQRERMRGSGGSQVRTRVY